MKFAHCVILGLLAAGSLAGCGGGGSAASGSTLPPVAVSGVDTPKSVSVVTAN